MYSMVTAPTIPGGGSGVGPRSRRPARTGGWSESVSLLLRVAVGRSLHHQRRRRRPQTGRQHAEALAGHRRGGVAHGHAGAALGGDDDRLRRLRAILRHDIHPDGRWRDPHVADENELLDVVRSAVRFLRDDPLWTSGRRTGSDVAFAP